MREEEETRRKGFAPRVRASFDLYRRVYRMTANINHLNGGIDKRRMSHRAAAYANLASQFDRPDECTDFNRFSVIAGSFCLISRLRVAISNENVSR